MRLNGRKSILVHLGRSAGNRRGWRRVREDYAGALHYLPGSLRVWTTAEELDGLDRARSLTVAQVVNGANRDAIGGPVKSQAALNAWQAMLRNAGASSDALRKHTRRR